MRDHNLAASRGNVGTDPPQHPGTWLITRHLPLFAVGWLTTTLAWGLALILESRLSIFPATVLFVFQLGVLIAAIAICHSGASTSRVPLVALAACVLLAMSSTTLFAAIGGYGEMLGFILLTLYLATSPLFAWSRRAALALLVGTLVPWLVAIPFLKFFLRPADLAFAISMGTIVCLITLVVARRSFRLTQQALKSSNTFRDLADQAPDMIFTVSLDGHYTYVNDALARFLGEPAVVLVGRYRYAFITDNPANPDLYALADKLAAGEEVPPQVYEVRSVHGPRWVETVFSGVRAADGRVVRIRGCTRDVHTRHVAELELRASLEALRQSEEELRKLAQQLPTAAGRPDTTDIIGFNPHGPGSEERASIALFRKPLATLKDEEVHGLKKELNSLRQEVRRQHAAVERRVAEAAEEDRARRPRRGSMITAPAGVPSPPDPEPLRYPARFRGRKRKPPQDD